MIIDRIICKQCSHCSKVTSYIGAASMNTFGGERWTDRKGTFPMDSFMDELARCKYCKQAVWIEKEETVYIGKITSNNGYEDIFGDSSFSSSDEFVYDEEYGTTGGYLPAKRADYVAALLDENLDLEKEIYLRTSLWWLDNDKRRDKNREIPSLSDEEIANMKSLYDLLDERSDPQRLMMVEILRELGEYDAAAKLVHTIFGRSVPQEYVETITMHIERNNSSLEKISY